jgi:hypothetical protein
MEKVVRMGDMRNYNNILAGKPDEKINLFKKNAVEEKTLKLSKYSGEVWIGYIWLCMRTSGGTL